MQSISFMLSQLRSSIRTLFVMNGMARLLLVLSAVAAFTFVCDFFFHLPQWFRIVLLAGSVLLFGWIAVTRLVYPMGRKITDDELALCLEDNYPEAGCCLISAIQLSRDAEDPQFPYSRQLVERLVREADEMADSLDPRKALNASGVKILTAAAVIALGVLTAGAVMRPVEAGIWFNRFLGGSARWPQKTELKVTYPEKAIKGDPVTLTVRAVRGAPSSVLIHYEFQSADEGDVTMKAEEDGSFTYTFPQVLVPLSFKVFGGDDEQGPFEVGLDVPPRIEGIQVFRKYPEYTKLPPTPPQQPEVDGNMKTLIGTEVTVTGKANLPLQKGTLILKAGEREEKIGMTVLPPDRVQGAFTVRENLDYSMHVVGRNKLDNKKDPIRYAVVAVTDRTPAVTIKKPGQNRQVLIDTIVNLEIEANDDFGIKELALKYRVASPGEAETDWKIIPLSFPDQNVRFGPREAKLVHPLDLHAMKLNEGDLVTYLVQATDYNTVTGTGTGESASYQLKVVGKKALEEGVERSLREILLEIESLLNDQKKNLSDTQDFKQAAGKGPLSEKALKRLPYIEFPQEQITQRTKNLTLRIDQMVEDIRLYQLSQILTIDKLGQASGVLRRIGWEQSPRAHQLLGSPAPGGALAESIGIQEDIAKELKELLALMDVLKDLSYVIRTTQGLINDTADVERYIREYLRKRQ